jgi:hypothetical protein
MVVAGCALMLGDAYEPLRTVPRGMGVVYIYDSGAGVGSRVFIDPDLETPSARHYLVMAPDGYYPYLTSEGTIRIFDDTPSNPFGCVEIEVKSAEPKWVSVSERGDVLEVKTVEPANATSELGKHRRLTRRALAKSSGVSTPTNCKGTKAAGKEPNRAVEPREPPKIEKKAEP